MFLVRRTFALLALALALVASASAAGHAVPDPTPNQTIRGDQQWADGPTVVDMGHVDIAPRLEDDGRIRLRVHDDSVRPSVWRATEDVVFAVGDQAAQQLPEDPAYGFLGKPGAAVHVLPQTQQADLVWVGWNTQDPALMKAAQRGVSLSLERVSGPGAVVVYLQSGTLGAPDVLWDSRKAPGQELWVDTNTHTHGNWVFTEPGVYAVELGVSATLRGGQTVQDRQVLRFAVGTQDDQLHDAAFAVELGARGDGHRSTDRAGALPLMPVAVVALGVAVVLVPLLGVFRRRALRRRLAEEGGR